MRAMFGRWFSAAPEATPAAAPSAAASAPQPPPVVQATRVDGAGSPSDAEVGTILIALARKLQKNTLIRQDFTTSEEFALRFDVTPSHPLQNAGNIFSLETGDGSTLVEFSLLPNSTTLQCVLARPQDAPLTINASSLPIGRTSRVEAQLQAFAFTISVDGVPVCSSPVPRGMPAMQGTKIWASGRKHAAAAASIANLVYTPLKVTAEARPTMVLHSVPAVPETWPELASSRHEELEFLRSNEEAVDDWILGHEQARACAQRLKDLRESNAETARNIIVREADQRSLAERCEQGRAAAESRRRSLAALLARKEALLQRQKPEHLAQTLSEKANASEAAAEACLAEVISEPGTLDGAALTRFKEQFLGQKTDKHMRMAMRERLLQHG